MEKSLRQNGVEPDECHYAAEVTNTESILAMVETGIGLSIVSHFAIQKPKRENLTVLYEIPTDRFFYLACQEARVSHPLIQAFMRETLQLYKSESSQ